jgi:ABC-2 type transport system permease protein
MKNLATILRKELRAYFLSPIALIFLGIFLLAVLFSFFTGARFFARNIADVRPLFEWLPVLLIFLVAAITMRAWSEEQKLGTLEILLTLPLRIRDLVLAKLLAGLVLVGIALALTLPLPITAEILGDLDWGPVVGGYLGALLLAAAYLSIGMCVSACTDNQIVSLMVTSVICGLFMLVGSDMVTGFFGTTGAELLRSIGSASRFRSIERGVLDLRDLFYYASLTAFFFLLNIQFLEMKRRDVVTAAGRKRLWSQWLTVVLAGLNVVAGNLWLAPITAARADMTAEGLYSVSSSTRRILAGLQEPLTIAGYFSEKTHPLLTPLVPRIRDMLTEYQIHGRGKVKLEFADPNLNEEMREEVAELYDIRSVPFRVSARHEESVVNSYFHILVRYGDQYEVLSFDELIEIEADQDSIDIRLRNLEYDLTRSIKKVVQGFRSLDAMFAQLDKPVRLTAYMTPDKLPDEFKESPERIRKVAAELEEKGGKKFIFQEVNPGDDEALQMEIARKYDFRPLSADLFGKNRFYLYLLLEAGNRQERIMPQGDLTEAAIRTAIEAGVKRATPGFLKNVGLLTEQPPMTPPNPQLPPQFQPPQRKADYQMLQKGLGEEYKVKRVKVDQGFVPNDIDVLIVARPGKLTDKQKFGIDQFLMRGGAVIAFAGAYDVSVIRTGLEASKEDKGFLEMLANYGVEVQDAFAMDSRNARFPVPIEDRSGPFTFRRIKMMNYPFFPDIRAEGMAKGHVAMSGLHNVIMNWSSPLEVAKKLKEVKAEKLITTSPESWTYGSADILPKTIREADSAFQPSSDDKRRAHTLAVTLVGRFKSFFADKPSPLFGADQKKAEARGKADRTGRTVKRSPPDARLVVVGSSAFASDLINHLAGQVGGGLYRGNFQLVRNLLDWSLADTDLLQIRSVGAFARTLDPLEDRQRTLWEAGNYLFALAALLGVVFFAIARRRWVKPIVSREVKS